MILKKLFFISLIFFGLNIFALDRVQLVQSKIQSSLTSILPSSDFLIVVNRLDTLEDGGASQVVDGTVKMLPGLNLGVDSKGDLIRQDSSGNSYFGPVSIRVIVDQNVKQETYKTLQSLLPEIVGGIRDDDELNISRGTLRQLPVPVSNSPQVSIQNSPGSENQFQENLKFLAVLVIATGLMVWLLSRMSEGKTSGSKNNETNLAGSPANSKNPDQPFESIFSAAAFGELDPESVALYMMKKMKDRDLKPIAMWTKYTPAQHQRNVLGTLPPWVITYTETLNAELKVENAAEKVDSSDLQQLFNDVTLIEQVLRGKVQKNKAFLKWFPAEGIRFIPKQYQSSFSAESRRTLWSVRPDLGDFVRIQELEIEQMMTEPNESQISSCVDELKNLPTNVYDISSIDRHSVVYQWVHMISQLNEFNPIESQLAQAKAKLNDKDFDQVYKSVAHLQTPFLLSPSDRKNWLRLVEPQDYYWWLHIVEAFPAWKLTDELRPMRLAMFKQAEVAKAFESWSEDEKKLASKRVIAGLREALQASKTGIVSAAA